MKVVMECLDSIAILFLSLTIWGLMRRVAKLEDAADAADDGGEKP